MLRVLIIEDERPARERLAGMVREVVPPCEVAGAVDSIAAVTEWLGRNAAPDLILADIQLGDGLSVDLFRATPPPCPVVFTTAHDDYLMDAFATQGIAYLLKPVKRAELEGALKKYRELGRHFAEGAKTPGPVAKVETTVGGGRLGGGAGAPRQRILAQRGAAYQPVALADAAYFFSENKLTFLITRAGERCLVNEPLGTLEGELEASQFFRVNRNYLVQVNAVKSFSPVGKGRLAVQLSPRPVEEVVISQENAAEFRAWISR